MRGCARIQLEDTSDKLCFLFYIAHGAAADDDEEEYDIVMIMTREQVGILRTGRSDYRRNNSADPAIHASSSSSAAAAAS